ncbi:MAG TPA: CehA/McbA family metallohydrolase [Urbifossiella sp.]|nr:CehA/McbA family metallohydrolase [Urbifossiella sp.]
MNGRFLFAALALAFAGPALAVDPPPVIGDVEGQPLAQNAVRLIKTLDFIGAPLAADVAKELQAAIDAKDAKAIQQLLDKKVLFVVNINPEARVKVARGPADAKLQQAGYVPVLVKIVNESTVKKTLKIASPQAGNRYSGRGERNPKDDPKIADRFLQLEMYSAPPMSADLSGLKVEYAIALIYSTEAGKREATISFDIGQGNQDLGFRGEVPVLFDVKPAIPVTVRIADFDGKPTVARLTITDASAHVFPPQPKRLGQDFFFQKQIYRPDGGRVLLPPGEFTIETGRGPEYRVSRQKFRVVPGGKNEIAVKLERWINPAMAGWYSGDHHIHAAGCAHYTNPTEGVMPEDMFLHVKGEGMNVGCCLTWGPCYDFQRRFFEAAPNRLSEPFTVLKYDVEVSGFGSQALGHVCLLNLADQTYPGSAGTKVKGWPTWTTPLMRWGKEQGAVTGYAHSANGLGVNVREASSRLFAALDANKDGSISREEAAAGKWPLVDSFTNVDANGDGSITAQELAAAHAAKDGKLPNLIIPRMDGIGAQEICVTSAMGVCDFISAMDTDRVPEWNCWYHIMNCGFPLKVSGETDFPCITGNRVGQGRVYVQLGKIDHIDFAAWCKGIQKGQSYVSDGYAHALDFRVNGTAPGFGEVKLDAAGNVKVSAKVAFASKLDLGTANGAPNPVGPNRKLELIVNGQVVASKEVSADDQEHDLSFDVPIARSSWVALRQFPQMHTNAVPVLVGGKPIRASRASAKWCIGVIEKLWDVRGKPGPGPRIAADERPEAEKTFHKALDMYRKIADEAEEGS